MGAGCWGACWAGKGWMSAGLGAPHPLCSRGAGGPRGLGHRLRGVTGREWSPCLAPGMAEDRRDRDLLYKMIFFFFSPLFFIHKPNTVPQFPDM